MGGTEERRQYGTGSIVQRKRDGKWIGRIEAGWTASGARRRIEVVADTREKAETKLRAKQKQISREGLPSIKTKTTTVKAYADQWLEDTSRDLRPETWKANRSQLKNWIVPTIGRKQLGDLTPKDVRSVTVAMLKAGKAPSTALRAHNVTIGLLKAAAVDGRPINQSCLLVKPPAANESHRDAIPLDDALAILRAASSVPDASRWVAALLQGMRPAECLGLTWSAIDLDHDTADVSWQLKPLPYRVTRDVDSGFRIPVGYEAKRLVGAYHLVRPKTRSGRRVVPLVPWMRAALVAWKEVAPPSPHDLVWPASDGSPRLDKDDRQAWRDLCDAARVARVDGKVGRRYDLYEARHTTATLLSEAGVSEHVIIAIMGHSSIASTRAYQHTNVMEARRALDAVASTLGLTAE